MCVLVLIYLLSIPRRYMCYPSFFFLSFFCFLFLCVFLSFQSKGDLTWTIRKVRWPLLNKLNKVMLDILIKLLLRYNLVPTGAINHWRCKYAWYGILNFTALTSQFCFKLNFFCRECSRFILFIILIDIYIWMVGKRLNPYDCRKCLKFTPRPDRFKPRTSYFVNISVCRVTV